MKHRFVLALLLVPVAALALVLGGRALSTRAYMDEASLQANSALRLAVSALAGHMSRYEALPALVADHDDVRDLVLAPHNEKLRAQANTYLKEINALLESSDIYVITPDGQTIAASNFDGPASFVGQNFSYRPYFQKALEGAQARFYALGTTSLKRGYYFSSPVLANGEIRGVIVFKVDVDAIESTWRGGEYKIFVSDPEGIIFMTGSPEWLYAGLLPLTPERLARTEESRRYANATLRALPVKRSMSADQELLTISSDTGDNEYLVLSQYMPEADWTVNVMIDTGSIRTQANMIAIAIFLAIGLAALALAIILQRRARLAERMQLQVQSRNELERRVEERTADLALVNERIAEEITERRLTEQQLRQTQADLIQAGKLAGLGQMSAALSHEFNQPLAAAKTYADSAAVLIDRSRVNEARDNIMRISSLIDRMTSISRHLRNFARKPNEKLSPVRLDDVLKDTMEIVAWRVQAADAILDINLGPEAPIVMAGSIRLQQVLVNVISNAADAVEGLPDRRIDISASRDGPHVLISIRDHGPGVPAAIAQRIFDPFFTTKGVGKGLGLGLSISFNIVKDFGGNLTTYNHPEGGAVFCIKLNAADAGQQEAAE